MGLRDLFTETQDEIRTELEIAKERVKELEDKLKRSRTKKKSNRHGWTFVLLFLAVLIVATILWQRAPCKDNIDSGTSQISCIKVSELEKDMHSISFRMRNTLSVSSECFTTIEVRMAGIPIYKKENPMGTYLAGEEKDGEVRVAFPEGNSEFELSGSCRS